LTVGQKWSKIGQHWSIIGPKDGVFWLKVVEKIKNSQKWSKIVANWSKLVKNLSKIG
jgi:hypothetical protein